MNKIILRYFILIFFVICLIPVPKASAVDFSIESEIGYDDNVAQISEKKGSGFGLYRINIVQPLNFKAFNNKSLETSLFAQGGYNDYFSVKDNYYLNPGAAFSWPIYGGLIIPGITSDLFFFRDNYLEEDSKNEVTAGIFAQWIISSRLTLEIKQNWQWADYKEPVVIKSAESLPGFTPGPDFTPGNQVNMVKNQTEKSDISKTLSRDDRVMTTGLQAIYYFSPDFQADLVLEHAIINSSIDIESFKENKIAVSLNKIIDKLWEFSLSGSVKHSDYESVPERNERQDTAWNTHISCSHFIKSFELRFQYLWEYNDSDEPYESYHQQVTQCGIIWSF